MTISWPTNGREHPASARRRREGAIALGGVLAVLVDVGKVVDQVHAATGGAEHQEAGQSATDERGVGELEREDQAEEQQAVLDPLLRPTRPNQATGDRQAG